jgi:hypothetical protein
VRLLLAALLAAAIVPAAFAAHPSQLRETKANLDRDRALERIVGTEDVSSDHSVWRASVAVVDRCRGRDRSLLVLDGYQRLETARALQADGRGARETLGLLRGPAVGAGEARLVRLVARAGRCPSLRTLFRYAAARAEPGPVPELRLIWFTVDVVELARRYSGREIRLIEQFSMPPKLSSVHRETLYRHVRARDVYVAYATRTHRVP